MRIAFPEAVAPRPFVGEEETEYVATPPVSVVAPLGAPVSAVPTIVPTPSAVNSPEKIGSVAEFGVLETPA